MFYNKNYLQILEKEKSKSKFFDKNSISILFEISEENIEETSLKDDMENSIDYYFTKDHQKFSIAVRRQSMKNFRKVSERLPGKVFFTFRENFLVNEYEKLLRNSPDFILQYYVGEDIEKIFCIPGMFLRDLSFGYSVVYFHRNVFEKVVNFVCEDTENVIEWSAKVDSEENSSED
jgi:hypothetical protein